MTTNALSLPAESVETSRAPGSEWGLAERIGLRFAFCYWVLYCLPEWGRVSLVDVIPGAGYLGAPYIRLWHKLTPWTAQHLFHLSGSRITYFMTGSGDTTLDYVENFLFIVIAVLATLVWSLLDRRRAQYGTLYVWLRILLRFTLAVTLFSYGLAKVFPMQFRPPNLVQLTETYGEASPMGLLWTFMGASMAYTIFSGVAEVTAATLLLFRRTVLLGALVAMGVLLNIVMLNFCYDVPVKLYSFNLLLMAVFLLLPDISRLADMFLFNRSVGPADLKRPYLPKRWMRVSTTVLKLAAFAFFISTSAWGGWQFLRRSGTDGEPPVYGAYTVDSMNLTETASSGAKAGNPAWVELIADRGFWMVKQRDDTREYLAPHFDPKRDVVNLLSRKTQSNIKLNYMQSDSQHLVLTGDIAGANTELRLHRIDGKQFLLTSRGFHWISEYPFNR